MKAYVDKFQIVLLILIVGMQAVRADIQADGFSVQADGQTTVQSGMDGRAVTIRFAETSPTAIPSSPLPVSILVGGADPSTLFSGDLSAYSGMRFRLVGDGQQPSRVSVVIRRIVSTRHHIWRHEEADVSAVSGEWLVVRLPFNPADGWTPVHTVGSRYTLEETWDNDIADVDSITIEIARNGHEEQAYSLADFMLVGKGGQAITSAARLTMIEDYFGVSSIEDIDRTLDSNGNGMSDYDMIRAGLDPRDPTAVFAANMERVPAGNVVRWPGVLGGRYAVMRSNDLRDGFQVIPAAADVRAGFTGEQVFVDENPLEVGPNFYKVIKY